MVDIAKIDMTDIWASSGDKTKPNTAKIAQGWLAEIVPRQTWNWFENRQDQNLAYLFQKGVVEWDITTEYQANKSYVQRNGVLYKALTTAVGQDPVTANTTYWVKAFIESSPYLESLKSLAATANTTSYINASGSAASAPITAFVVGLLNSANATAFRSGISAQAANSNLTALSGVTPATNALPYFDTSTTMTTTQLGTTGRSILAAQDQGAARIALGLNNGSTLPVGTGAGTIAAGDDSRITGAAQKSANLSDLANAITARANLGLTAVASTPITTSRTDNNTGRIMKVGDFGVGTDGVPVTDINALLPTSATGFYKLTTPFTGSPVSGTPMTVQHTVYDNQATQYASYEGAASPRLFIRKYSNTAWQAWVEVYHSGNSSALVSQVTANVQPVLDTKINRAGDTFAGSLISTNTTVGFQSQSTTPKFELHKPGVFAGMWWINSANKLAFAQTNGSGVASSELLTLDSAGTLAVAGNFSAGLIAARGAITATDSINANSGVVNVQAATTAANAHVYFRNTDGAERALIYVDNSSGIHIRSNAGTDTMTLDVGKGVTFGGAISVAGATSLRSTLNVAGAVNITSSLYASSGITSAYALYAGAAFMDTGGNIYGSTWSGYLSTYLTNNFITAGNIGQNMANQGTGAIGSYAYLGNTSGSTIPPGGTLGGGLNYASNGSNGGGAAGGTWRAMGYGVNGQFTVWQRIA
jgi:hypothetical protein